ncbi:penicillin-binding protein 1C [Alphaproteobacteria bacterium]|nr:penicillin-binding protein 1C [Alphaproteobacteria bacterium]
MTAIRRFLDWTPLWIVVVVLGGIALADRLFPPPMARAYDLSPTMTDVDGRLLRAGISPAGYWRLSTELADVDSHYVQALLAFEDQRFYRHHGVDYRGMARAVVTSLRARRLVSGGSTLTMQTARLLEPRPNRTVGAKIMEILRAWQLERRYTKEEILDLYLTTAPFGGNIEGAGAAAWRYFGKKPADLTWAESALMVALPQSPVRRRPDRFADRAEAARNRVLDVLVLRGVIAAEQALRGKREPVPDARLDMPFYAPTLAERFWSSEPTAQIETTLHGPTQRRLERLMDRHISTYDNSINGALLVLDAETGAVTARVGSSGYFEQRAGAKLDLTQALRSPGSALKPALYALAFDAGQAHPGTWLPDDRRNFAGYQPENFHDTRQGRVQAYAALQQSLNPPAIAILNEYGAERALEALTRVGVAPANIGEPGSIGLSLMLGGVSLTMEDLAQVYTAFATDGRIRPLCETPAACAQTRPTRFIRSQTAGHITAILSDVQRPHTFNQADTPRIAFKTGTSARNRDAWAVGYDGKYVIAAWIGRPDNQPTETLVGLVDAAPLLFHAFEELDDTRPLTLPAGGLDHILDETPLALQHYAGLQTDETDPFRLTFPTDGAVMPLRERGGIALKLSGGRRPFRLFVDGTPRSQAIGRQITWMPNSPGFYDLAVLDKDGNRVSARVEITAGFGNLAQSR